MKPRPKPPIGAVVFSEYFNRWLVVTDYQDDSNWWFALLGEASNHMNRARTRLADMQRMTYLLELEERGIEMDRVPAVLSGDPEEETLHKDSERIGY